MTVDRWDTIRAVVILCCAVPFFFFLHTHWARAALLAYLLTAVYFGLLLVPEYPPFPTVWFWKVLVPVSVMHSTIVWVLVWLDLEVPYVNKMPRALYGFAAVILFAEWRLAIRIIDALEPPK